ncbi:hypothetical protein [Bombella saccharophila]|uniref:SAF domain-containing protein n=1 Tax=Bombella saccharophila TaxID=2967338 RepID=A0ABT3W3R1_9PROT|nr:hypothetical protein [Bombella saccharophila]MCX5613687.1 hypothetical protein [Bombella saccharophila]PHI97536.1 hypothetical protein BG621_01945 [Parasaccharibacter apium]
MMEPQSPSPTPEPKKSPLWRPAALAAAVAGLGGAVLAFNAHPPAPSTPPQPRVIQQTIPITQGALVLSMLPPHEAENALASSTIPNNQKPALLAALKDNRIRLAALPLVDANQQTGQSLTVSTAGFTQHVILGPRPRTVLLPISQQGVITLTRQSPAQMGPLSIATLNMFHSVVVLPPLTPQAPALSVPVIVQ